MALPLGALLLVLALGPALPASAHRKLLVFLLDGFRSDYISDEALESLPGFKEIVSRGVKVDYLTPDFPSLSYPNYYTLMTGRHCEVHQMIGNYMWDPNTNKSFDIGVNRDSLMPLWWNGSEPLWVTLTKAKRKVHMYYWPGCEVEILGVRPTYCLEYKSVPTDINFANAVSDALDSFKSGRADLAAIYYERIDVEGHHYGPSSPQRKDALKAVDTVFKYMTQWIQERELQDKLNVIIFSDHGMTDIFWMDKVIELNKHISLRDLQQVKDRGPVVSLWPAPGKHSEIYNKLRTVEHMTVYEKEAIPSRFYYKKGKFVSPLTLVADEGWFITEPTAGARGQDASALSSPFQLPGLIPVASSGQRPPHATGLRKVAGCGQTWQKIVKRGISSLERSELREAICVSGGKTDFENWQRI